jgi:hypothetical protein
MVRCRARCQRTTCFTARVGFCAASFLNFDFPRDFPGCSVPVLSAFGNGLRSPSAKEKVDTREWKVEFLHQRVLVESTIHNLLSTLCEARPCNSVHGACGVAFRVALPKSSRFSSRASRQNTGGFAWPNLAPIHTHVGGWNRTLREPKQCRFP